MFGCDTPWRPLRPLPAPCSIYLPFNLSLRRFKHLPSGNAPDLDTAERSHSPSPPRPTFLLGPAPAPPQLIPCFWNPHHFIHVISHVPAEALALSSAQGSNQGRRRS